MLANILMNSVYGCLLIEAVLFIFKYRLRLKGYLLLYIIPTTHYLFSYQMVKRHPTQGLKDYVIFLLCCSMEYAIMITTAFLIEYEEVYLATIILMLYVPAANILLMGLSSLSKKLSEAQRAYLISYENVRLLPAVLIILITLLAGWLCPLIFAVIYQKLKGKNRLFYQILMLLILSVMLVSSAAKHKYYYIARNSSMKSRIQIAGVGLVMFLMLFMVLNLVIYFYNRYELRQLMQENSQTQRFVNALQQQYVKVEQSNRDMKQMMDSEIQDKSFVSDIGEEMLHDVSLTGNLMLDTLFTYYSHMAREKNIVFEIQSELAGGEVIKVENYQISAQTKVLDENGNEIDAEEEERKELLKKRGEDISLMQQIDMVTISDGVLSIYFDKAEEKEGYIFVNLKLGGGKLMLDYELNKELYIDRLSFGTCNQYKKLKPVRRIVHLKNGVVSCVSKEGRQRISVMFVGER